MHLSPDADNPHTLARGNVRALSIQEPYAQYILSRLKTVECRSWQTPYRGDLLICASQRREPGFICGYAVCLVTLENIRPFTKDDLAPALMDYWEPDLCAWDFTNPRLIEPFPVKGRLRLYPVDNAAIHVVCAADSPEAQAEFTRLYAPLMRAAGADAAMIQDAASTLGPEHNA